MSRDIWPEPGWPQLPWMLTEEGEQPDGWLAIPSLPRVESVMQQRHWPYDTRITVNVHYTVHPPAGLCVPGDRCWCPARHLPPHCEEPEPASVTQRYIPPRWFGLAVAAVLILMADALILAMVVAAWRAVLS